MRPAILTVFALMAVACQGSTTTKASNPPPVNCSGDAKVPTIVISDYDLSCTQDSDCTAIAVGNSCDACSWACSSASINVQSSSQYDDDKARLSAGLNLSGTCFCPGIPNPTCCNRQCSLSQSCSDAGQ